jgi:hypothetical protein
MGLSGNGGDRSEVRDCGGSPSSFGGGVSPRWWHSGITSCSYGDGELTGPRVLNLRMEFGAISWAIYRAFSSKA